jgi:putative hemolysin
MKQTITLMTTLALGLLLMSSFTEGPIMPNPSVEYAKFLGYKVEIRQSSRGGSDGFVIFPDKSECEAWQFYRGLCGQKYSYCVLKGCQTESIKEPYGSGFGQYCACSCKDSVGNKIVILLNEFMEQHGDTLIKHTKGIDN